MSSPVLPYASRQGVFGANACASTLNVVLAAFFGWKGGLLQQTCLLTARVALPFFASWNQLL
jgi:hypothetical protein